MLLLKKISFLIEFIKSLNIGDPIDPVSLYKFSSITLFLISLFYELKTKSNNTYLIDSFFFYSHVPII